MYKFIQNKLSLFRLKERQEVWKGWNGNITHIQAAAIMR